MMPSPSTGNEAPPRSDPTVGPDDGSDPDAMRVAFDVTPMIGMRTGVGNLVAGFYDALRLGGAVELVAYATTVRGRAEIRRQLGANVAPLPARVLRASWLRTDWPPVEMWARHVDLVHGMNYVVPPTRSGHAIVSVHDLTVVRFPELCTADTLEYPELLRRAFRRGAHVHVDSRFIGDEVAEWSGLSNDRIHVVKPGLSAPTPASSMQPAGPRDNPDEPLPSGIDGRPFVLALGTVEPRKDLPTLVRAFAEVAAADPELLLVVAGADGWGAEAFTSAVDALPSALRARVLRIGYVDRATREVLLRRARLLAFPSVYEGFGLPPLEAMQRGTPVVSSDAGSLPEVLGSAARYVGVGDHVRLAEEILRVHHDTALRRAMVAEGATRAAMYTWDTAAREMVDAYRLVVSQGAP